MTISADSLIADWYAVLKSGSAGATVRAALGNGAASVITADDLRVESLPAAPCVALRVETIAGTPQREAERLYLSWWAYDDVPRRYSRLTPLIAQITAAYPELTALAYAHVRRATVAYTIDRALGARPAVRIPFVISWR
ncbi:MAG TPA: hypothetical protein PKK15_22240 [Kouleothrix sp.]|nr:hypothetical protein [Kouleothrix sp.]